MGRGFDRHPGDSARDMSEVEGSKQDDREKNAEGETEVTHAVHNERLVARVGSKFFFEIEAYEQITTKPDPFPADEHQQKVRCEHQNQHEKHEQVHKRKKSRVSFLVSHVADGVNVNQQAHAGDHQQHNGGEAIDNKIAADTQ